MLFHLVVLMTSSGAGSMALLLCHIMKSNNILPGDMFTSLSSNFPASVPAIDDAEQSWALADSPLQSSILSLPVPSVRVR
jgi:hypothetical protein